jgi:hypothetical protein
MRDWGGERGEDGGVVWSGANQRGEGGGGEGLALADVDKHSVEAF